MGTATYMSPEQARGQQVDARTDIFSLGVVLYELLTRRLPYDGSSFYEIIAAVLSDREAPPLSLYSSGIPAELERIVAKALRKNREERYQTAKDLLLDLQSLRQRLELEKAHPTTVSRSEAIASARPPRRMPMGVLGVVCGLLVLAGGAIGYGWWRQAHAAGQSEIKSLAVLPLKSLDAGDNYLGLGIADAAIRRISQTGRLIVRPTSAVRRYLSEDTDALTAAKQLGVDAVLEGSSQRAGDRLRVSVNLLRCLDGKSLWADSFDIPMADIFTVQDTVAQQVASRLRLQMDASQQAQLTKRYTSNPVAYEFYLKGAYTFDQRMRDPAQLMASAISFYKQAIEADPNFALAHAQLAYAYAHLAVFMEPTQPAWVAHAKEEIDRAQALDPQLADTHLARFQLLYSQFEGYQGEAAAREALLANKLNPNVGHGELAYIYNHLGLEDLAARELARALEIDPTSEAPGTRRSSCTKCSPGTTTTPPIEAFAVTAGWKPCNRWRTVAWTTRRRRSTTGRQSSPTTPICLRRRRCSSPREEIFAPRKPKSRSFLPGIRSRIRCTTTRPTTSPASTRWKARVPKPSSG